MRYDTDQLTKFIMQPKAGPRSECPIARAVETVWEGWSLLILRDAFQGFTRFDEFRQSLGIAPNILSRRLAHLTKAGLLEQRLYSERPQRYEYVLTDKGRDFFPILVTLFAWGNTHLTAKGKSMLLAERETGRVIDPILVSEKRKVLVTPDNAMLIPGPRASSEMRRRLSSLRALGQESSPDKKSR